MRVSATRNARQSGPLPPIGRPGTRVNPAMKSARHVAPRMERNARAALVAIPPTPSYTVPLASISAFMASMAIGKRPSACHAILPAKPALNQQIPVLAASCQMLEKKSACFTTRISARTGVLMAGSLINRLDQTSVSLALTTVRPVLALKTSAKHVNQE